MIFMFLYLIFAAIIFFFIITLIFIPYGFTMYSLVTIFTVPQQILNIAKNKDIRRNHALEHATSNILEKYAGRTLPISGIAQKNGFIISGLGNPDLILQAAQEGLRLLKDGECDLAIHGRCGTSIAIANFTAAVIFLLILILTGHFSILTILISLILANMLGRNLGKLIQKYFTTSCDVENMHITGIEPEYKRDNPQYLLLNYIPEGYLVRTIQDKLIGG